MKYPLSKITCFILFLCLINLWNCTVHAQDRSSVTIAPGSDKLSLEMLHPYTHSYELHLVSGDQKTFAGTLTDELRIDSSNNVIERVQILERPNQPPHTDSVRAKLDSLAPLSHSSVNKNRTVSLVYGTSGVTGSYQSHDSSEIEIREVFDDLYFDSNWVDLVLRILPLEEGKELMLQTHEITPGGESIRVPYEIKVAKTTTLRTGNGKEEKVRILHQKMFQAKTTYYLKENTLELLKIKIPVTPRQNMIITKIR